MSLAHQNIEALVASCKQKDQKAEFEIYNRYSKAMYNVAYRIVKDEHYAEDVMQEGFLRAFMKIHDYKQEVAFGAWLKRIVINHSIDFYKKQKNLQYRDFEEVLFKIEDTGGSEFEMDFQNLRVEQVLHAIQNLKDNYRMVLTLFFIEGYDQEEITEILNISYANCRTTISRAKESLRKALTEMN